jgi:hypothetical protein
MKNQIMAIICLSVLTGSVFAGDVKVKVTATAATCGKAGVDAYKACIAKSQEDIYRTLELNANYIEEVQSENATCTVVADCTYYEIID